MKSSIHAGLALALVTLLLAHGAALAQQSDEDELASVYGRKEVVSIASRGEQPLRRAAAVTSVITARDIADLGATELGQVLETVPGLHVSTFHQGFTNIYVFRGIFTGYNAQVLVLLDGTPINGTFVGGHGLVVGSIALDNIARIEVIRGPGSALYGADAFAGVINIITKGTRHQPGTAFGARVGSYRSAATWIEHGGKIGSVELDAYLGIHRSDGPRNIIEKDLQAILDPIFGTHASKSPGPIALQQRSAEVQLRMRYEDWRLRANYRVAKAALGTGIAESIGDGSVSPTSRLTSELSYHRANWVDQWDLSAALEYVVLKQKSAEGDPLVFPAGAFGGAFPRGVVGNPTFSEQHAGISVTGAYSGADGHRVLLGAGYRLEDMYDVGERKNFAINVIPGVGPAIVPLPGANVIEAAGNPALVYLLPQQRQLRYAFIQDEWQFARDWTLTLGLRRDQYSDFGSTTNPRLALVWDALYNLTVKALHGQAFRAPSFIEESPGNNPTNTGNPDIKPERIATNELVFIWEPRQYLKTTLALFHYRERDLIRFVPNADQSTGATAQNAGTQTGRGAELEVTWDASRAVRLSGSYSLQHSTDDSTGMDAGLAPRNRLLVRGEWRFAPSWQAGVLINRVADRRRQPGDLRPQIADYTTLDLSLRCEKLVDKWELRAGARNVLNRDVREPSLAPGNIPFDLPRPGRTVSIQLIRTL